MKLEKLKDLISETINRNFFECFEKEIIEDALNYKYSDYDFNECIYFDTINYNDTSEKWKDWADNVKNPEDE